MTECQGDCDADSDCLGDLVCFQRDGLDPVPGCSGSGTNNWDYCVAPGSRGVGPPLDDSPGAYGIAELAADPVEGSKRLAVLLSCPAIPGDAFPINIDDPQPRRRNMAFQPWPVSAEYANSTAVSRPLELVAGERYWLHLECIAGEQASATCGVGTRILKTERKAPRAASLASKRWRARVHRGESMHAVRCSEISDKAECCATVDSASDICTPAVSTFSDGSVCAGWNALLRDQPLDAASVAACPPHDDIATKTARPRVMLPSEVGCDSLNDRVACLSAIDGRSSVEHRNAPCIPATTTFNNGAVCETASYVVGFETGLRAPAASLQPYEPSDFFGQSQRCVKQILTRAHCPLLSPRLLKVQ